MWNTLLERGELIWRFIAKSLRGIAKKFKHIKFSANIEQDQYLSCFVHCVEHSMADIKISLVLTIPHVRI